jgi:hypothetical protein
MRFATWILLLCGAMSFPVAVGCDREISHKESTESKPNGTTVHEEKTVKEKPDGTVVKEQEKSVNKPANPNP